MPLISRTLLSLAIPAEEGSYLALTGVLGWKNSRVTCVAYHETAVNVHRPGKRQ